MTWSICARRPETGHLGVAARDPGAPNRQIHRLLDVTAERHLHFAEAMPSGANPSGWLDCDPLDRAIAQAEAERRAAGAPSRSRATPPA